MGKPFSSEKRQAWVERIKAQQQSANTWYWYENWLQFVKQHCEKNKQIYS